MRTILAALALACAMPAVAQTAPAADAYTARVANVLKETPLIYGHNDWALALHDNEDHWGSRTDLHDLTNRPYFDHVDINLLHTPNHCNKR